jgi:iron complex transport system ATP-binding protein
VSATLRYDDASVGYGGPVVNGARLDVRPGEVVGLIGPNGAGKTTLVRSVTGAARVLAGAVRIGERDVASYRPLELARVVGVLPQAVPPPFSFWARQFVEMGRHAHVSRFGGLGAADRAAVDRAMLLTDTDTLADAPVDTLSGGDLQRLTLAQALAQEPEILLLDEPTSHLDLNHRLQVLDVVRGLADDGMAVLAVFHDLDMAARYSDRLAVVAGGRLAEAGAPEAVLTSAMLSEVFGVAAVIGTDPVTGAVQVLPVARTGARAAARGIRVLVVSGSGSGAGVVRGLVLAGFDVEAGALARGDTDEQVAASLGVEFVALPPYGSMGAADEAAVREAASRADAVVVCASPFGPANLGNLRAVEHAASRMILTGDLRPEEDFTRGEAGRLWSALLGAGAVQCGDVRSVCACVEEVVGR